MIVRRGEIWWADLDPTRGSEQAGLRPILIFQNDVVNRLGTTVLAIPLTTNLKRAALPTAVLIAQGEGGLSSDSVALCHQMRAVDKVRLSRKLGVVSKSVMTTVEACVLFTLGIL